MFKVRISDSMQTDRVDNFSAMIHLWTKSILYIRRNDFLQHQKKKSLKTLLYNVSQSFLLKNLLLQNMFSPLFKGKYSEDLT